MTVLVTGGAGYIGSHTVLALTNAGERVVVLDNLSSGRRALVPSAAELVVGDVHDTALLEQVIRSHRVQAVIHFAGSIIVPESVSDPLKYYDNNTLASHGLIRTCVALEVGHFIFSSTAAVYGMAEEIPIREDCPTRPINPYGSSKLMTEWMLRDTAAATQLRYVALRYFNVAGADPAGRSGQSGPGSTHLLKVASEVVTGKRTHIFIHGTDYPTADGTCIRDYIHVSDLADAHVLALRHLRRSAESAVLNCGYRRGLSVREVIRAVEQVTGLPLPVTEGPRRPGDPPALVADSSRLQRLLSWQPRHGDLAGIIRTALDWERRLPDLPPN